MGTPFLGEVKMMAFNFPPKGWAFCNGQLLPINQNQPLFALYGTNFGGDGRVNFALPDLRGRVPIHQGNGFILAQTGGAEEVTLTVQQIPAHSHAFLGSTSVANNANPGNNVVAQALTFFGYINDAPIIAMAPQSIGPAGGSQPHTNFQPYLCVDFIISLFGIFPSPT